jgi:hypothetical protein
VTCDFFGIGFNLVNMASCDEIETKKSLGKPSLVSSGILRVLEGLFIE